MSVVAASVTQGTRVRGKPGGEDLNDFKAGTEKACQRFVRWSERELCALAVRSDLVPLQSWETFMQASYSSDELKTLARVLNDILVEARRARHQLSTDEIVQRVCSLSDGGERDAIVLRQAVFGTGHGVAQSALWERSAA